MNNTERARLGGLAHRSPALKKAWENAEVLKAERTCGVPVKTIAKKYKIGLRACYRILGS